MIMKIQICGVGNTIQSNFLSYVPAITFYVNLPYDHLHVAKKEATLVTMNIICCLLHCRYKIITF